MEQLLVCTKALLYNRNAADQLDHLDMIYKCLETHELARMSADIVLLSMESLLRLDGLKLSDKVLERIFQVIQRTVNQIKDKSQERLWSLIHRIIDILPTPSFDTNKEQQIREEVILADLNCLTSLCNVHQEFTSTNKTFIGYVSSSLLSLIMGRHKSLKAAAIEAFAAFLQLCDVEILNTEILPGALTILFRTVNGDAKQGSRVIGSALETIRLFLSLTMTDERWSGIIFTRPLYEWRESHHEDTTATIDQERNKWCIETAENIQFGLDVTLRSTSERHWKVRHEIALLCETILFDCKCALKSSLVLCIEALTGLYHDPIESVATEARRIIQLAKTTFSDTEWLDLLDKLRVEMSQRLESMDRNKTSAESLQHLRCLSGYISLLQTDVEVIFEASFDSIMRTWSRFFEIQSIETSRQVETTASALVAAQKKTFKHITDDQVLDTAQDVLYMLGTHASYPFVIDRVQRLLEHEDTYQAELIHISRLICRGVFHYDDPDPLNSSEWVSAAQNLLEFYVELLSKTPVVDIVILEAIGDFADILKDQFQELFLDLLYPLTEKLGSTDTRVEQTALSTLERITRVTGYQNVGALLRENLDYLVDTLTIRLQRLELYPWAPYVLNGLLKHVGMTTSLIEDAVWAVVSRMELEVDGIHTIQFLVIIATILEGLKSRLPISRLIHDEIVSPMDRFIRELDYFQQLDEPMEEENEEEEEDPNTKSHLDMITTMLNACAYVSNSPEFRIRSEALRVIQIGIETLAKDQKHLLPIVARLWPTIVKRLKDPDKAVVIAALSVIERMAQYCGSFIEDRVERNVWPLIRDLVRNLDTPVTVELRLTETDWSTHGRLTSTLQCSLVKCMLAICTLVFRDQCRIVTEIAEHFLRFLRPSEFPETQSTAQQLYRRLIRLNAGEMFVLFATVTRWQDQRMDGLEEFYQSKKYRYQTQTLGICKVLLAECITPPVKG